MSTLDEILDRMTARGADLLRFKAGEIPEVFVQGEARPIQRVPIVDVQILKIVRQLADSEALIRVDRRIPCSFRYRTFVFRLSFPNDEALLEVSAGKRMVRSDFMSNEERSAIGIQIPTDHSFLQGVNYSPPSLTPPPLAVAPKHAGIALERKSSPNRARNSTPPPPANYGRMGTQPPPPVNHRTQPPPPANYGTQPPPAANYGTQPPPAANYGTQPPPPSNYGRMATPAPSPARNFSDIRIPPPKSNLSINLETLQSLLRTYAIPLAVVVVLAIAAFIYTRPVRVPNIEFRDQNNETISLSEIRGQKRNLLLIFLLGNCQISRYSLGVVKDLYPKASKYVSFAGLFFGTQAEADKYRLTEDLPFPVLGLKDTKDPFATNELLKKAGTAELTATGVYGGTVLMLDSANDIVFKLEKEKVQNLPGKMESFIE